MQVVQTVQEIPEFPSEKCQDIAVSELSQEIDKVVTHALVELGVLAAQNLECLLGNAAHELFRVHLQRKIKKV